MKKYSSDIVEKVRQLRSRGNTYREIKKITGVDFPKSTLFELCKNTPLPRHYPNKVINLNLINLQKARKLSVEINKIKRREFFKHIDEINLPIVKKISDEDIAKIALAMLCLGEASKYGSGSSFCLGSSDPRIITIFLKLLRICFNFNSKKVRCTVQCRADQNTQVLEQYWMKVTKIPEDQFYKTRIDPRTIGKPTKKSDYKGVLRVDYLDTKVQLELESLSNLIYNELLNGPEV